MNCEAVRYIETPFSLPNSLRGAFVSVSGVKPLTQRAPVAHVSDGCGNARARFLSTRQIPAKRALRDPEPQLVRSPFQDAIIAFAPRHISEHAYHNLSMSLLLHAM